MIEETGLLFRPTNYKPLNARRYRVSHKRRLITDTAAILEVDIFYHVTFSIITVLIKNIIQFFENRASFLGNPAVHQRFSLDYYTVN